VNTGGLPARLYNGHTTRVSFLGSFWWYTLRGKFVSDTHTSFASDIDKFSALCLCLLNHITDVTQFPHPTARLHTHTLHRFRQTSIVGRSSGRVPHQVAFWAGLRTSFTIPWAIISSPPASTIMVTEDHAAGSAWRNYED